MRKQITYTATDGRDTGKKFHITEMGARPAHRWATRALFALLNGGADIPEDALSLGMAGIAAVGVNMLNGVSLEAAEPLLDELLTCVEVQPDPSKPEVRRKLFDEDIEEPVTYFKLQKEVLKLHLDFSSPDKS